MRIILIALALIVFWGTFKPQWERHLARNLEIVQHGNIRPIMTYEMRDKLGQGFALAALGGFRGLAANFSWLKAMFAWENSQWSRVHTYTELSANLQPRVLYYWDFGSWQLAWNASIWAEKNQEEKSQTRRLLQSQYWITEGRKMLEEGIEAIPEKPDLYIRMAELYWRRLKDYRKAHDYYLLATQTPDCPLYAVRFVGIALEEGGYNDEAYEYFKKLWFEPHENIPSHRHWMVIEKRLRGLENKLNLPNEKRIFTK